MKCADCKALNQEVEAFKHSNQQTVLTHDLLKQKARELRRQKAVKHFCPTHMEGGLAKDTSEASREFKHGVMKRQAKRLVDGGASILEVVSRLTSDVTG